MTKPALQLMPHLALPWAAELHPFHMQHALRSQAAAFEAGVLPLGSVREKRRFEAFIEADGWVYPYASRERLHAAGGFNQWLFFLDDQYDDDAAGRDPSGLRRIMDRAFGILQSGDLPGGKQEPTPFERWTHEIRWRLFELAPARWFERFLASTHDYLFDGSLRVIERWATETPWTLDEYIELRLHDSSVLAVFDMVEIAADAALPDSVTSNPTFVELKRCAGRHVAFSNDVFSYHKEVVRQGSRFHLLRILAEERQLTFGDATAAAVTMLDADVEKFVALEAALPRTSPDVDAALARYIAGLKAWMTGNLAFSWRSPRFRHPDAPFHELRAPA